LETVQCSDENEPLIT